MIERRYPDGAVLRVDDEDAHLLDAFHWTIMVSRLGSPRYAYRNAGGGRTEFLHRLILPPPVGLTIDHVDGDGLNNSRSNLRIATQSQNNANRRATRRPGRPRGVFYRAHSPNKPWMAQITVNRKCLYLGYYATEAEAATVYDKAASQHFGEFARLNGDAR